AEGALSVTVEPEDCARLMTGLTHTLIHTLCHSLPDGEFGPCVCECVCVCVYVCVLGDRGGGARRRGRCDPSTGSGSVGPRVGPSADGPPRAHAVGCAGPGEQSAVVARPQDGPGGTAVRSGARLG